MSEPRRYTAKELQAALFEEVQFKEESEEPK